MTAFAPGRVNLIGEHTDYNAGLALPFAIAEGVTVRAMALTTRRIEVLARDLGESDSFALGKIEPAPGWRAFVRGIVAELSRGGVELRGARLEISGTVPPGAGLGSSAALSVALALALAALAGQPDPDRVELAKLCSRVEHVWVGARSGLLDQLAALLAQEGNATFIDFRSLAVRFVPLALEGHRLALLDSRERHDNAASGYNQRRAECEQACLLLGIASLREATLDDAARLPPPLANRARHVVAENARVEAAIGALENGDLRRLGRVLDASHESARDLYELSTPAVEATVQRLRDAGAIGARLVGGGFGGSVLALMPPGAELPLAARDVRASEGATVSF